MERIQEVLINLRRIIRAADLQSKYLEKTAGLTSPQLLLMQAIQDHGEITVGELAREISLSHATVTTIIDRLEKRELVFRERSQQDKRRVYVHLTDGGRAMLSNAPTPMQSHFVQRFRDLPDWHQNMILSSVQRVAEMMDAGSIDASPFLDVGDLDRQYPPKQDKPDSKPEPQR